MIVSGKNKANRPFFFTGVDGARVEFAAMGFGQGDLEGVNLSAFQAQVKAGIIEQLDVHTDPESEKTPEPEPLDIKAQYFALTGKKADKRWSDKRVSDEVEKLKKD